MAACAECHTGIEGQDYAAGVLRLLPGGAHQQPVAYLQGLIVYLPIVLPVLVVRDAHDGAQAAEIQTYIHIPELRKGILYGPYGSAIVRNICYVRLYTGLVAGDELIHVGIVPILGSIPEELFYAFSALFYHNLIYAKHVKASAYRVKALLGSKYGNLHPLHMINSSLCI